MVVGKHGVALVCAQPEAVQGPARLGAVAALGLAQAVAPVGGALPVVLESGALVPGFPGSAFFGALYAAGSVVATSPPRWFEV